MKNAFLFHQKSSFRSWDNQTFIFPSFLLFLPIGHCFRGWSKINRKVYDAIDCLNKNSITHFVWYLEKEKRYDTETLSIDGVSNKEHLYEKNYAENMQQKLVPDLFIILVSNQNSHCIQETLFKVWYFERGLSKNLLKGNFIFSFEPSTFQ